MHNHSESQKFRPTFSIVMTCKKVDRNYLACALWSLTCQTMQEFELVFVCENIDDAEYVEDVCLRNDIKRVVYCGVDYKTRSERFKEAVNSARGEWIVNLDTDDFLHPDALWTLYRCLGKFPIMNFFSGSHKVFDTVTHGRGENPAAPLAQSVKSLAHSFRQRHLWGFRNEPSRWPSRMLETQYPVEDYWLFSVLAMNAVPILHIPHYLYAWRSHPGQWSKWHRNDCEQMSKHIQRYLREFIKKQSPMWHFGDMALATRLNACMVRLEQEVIIGDGS